MSDVTAALVLTLSLLVAGRAPAQTAEPASEYAVKAGYLYNFAK